MNVNLKSPRQIASVLLLSLALVGCASGPTPASPDFLQRIEAARTRGDHEALARHYDEQVGKARASAESHRRMGRTYQGNLSLGRSEANIAAHCDAIVRNQESIAAAYEAMASGHRQMAKQAQP